MMGGGLGVGTVEVSMGLKGEAEGTEGGRGGREE